MHFNNLVQFPIKPILSTADNCRRFLFRKKKLISTVHFILFTEAITILKYLKIRCSRIVVTALVNRTVRNNLTIHFMSSLSPPLFYVLPSFTV